MIEPLPAETQTLYAELLEQLLAERTRGTIGKAAGAFTSKTIRGEVYFYFQYSEPGGIYRQVYLGKKTQALERLARRFEQERSLEKEGKAGIERLCAQILIGGGWTISAAPGRVLKAFADAGVFETGAVLIGAHAFGIMGNLLGVRWSRAQARTEDIDLGAISMAAAQDSCTSDAPDAIERLKLGFLPVPGLDSRSASTSFKVRGKALRVDFLTPGTGAKPVYLSRLKTHAQPLPFLDYLLENPVRAAVLDAGGFLALVPDPARFALHKMIVAQERPVIEESKVQKDIAQACQILEHLTVARPGDVRLAADALHGRGWQKRLLRGWKRLEKSLPRPAETFALLE